MLLVALAWSATAHADSFSSCPGDKPSYDFGGLCYEPCKPGFVEVGPVCHRKAPLRDGSCDAGEEKDGALCYPKCKAGYKGVGPVCWQSCPGGFRDDGAFCAKPKAYGRGAGYPWKFGDEISLSAAKKRCESDHKEGCEKYGAIYYPKCKAGFSAVGCCICSPKCEDGMTDIGVSCAKQSYGRTAGRDPESYGRGVGVPLTSCRSSDISRPIRDDHTTTTFFLVFASDPQLSWYSTSGSGCSGDGCPLPFGDCHDDACSYRNAFKTNDHQLAAINGITSLTWPATGAKVAPPQGVIWNGDLTSYGHPEEWDWFMSYYVKGLNWPAYYGLGNHDYANNVEDCSGATADKNWCARHSIQWMRSTVSCGRSKPFPASRITGYHDKSMSYSWEIGPYHFVQLQNNPYYPKDESGDKPKTIPVPGIESSFTWLTSDLKQATAAGKHIIINMHDFGEHMKQDNAEFAAAIKGSNLRAIFAGHIHHDLGDVNSIQVGGRSVRVFRTGSSVYQRFLVVEFADQLLRVGKIDSSDGTPRLLGTDPVEEVKF